MKYIITAIAVIAIGATLMVVQPKANLVVDANSYGQGYAYGKKTGNSYLAPLPPQSKFNAGAAQAVKDTKK